MQFPCDSPLFIWHMCFIRTHQMWRARWTWGRNIQPCQPAGPSASLPALGRHGCGPWRPPRALLTWAMRAGLPLPTEEPHEAAWSTGRRWGRRARSMTCAAGPPRIQVAYSGYYRKEIIFTPARLSAEYLKKTYIFKWHVVRRSGFEISTLRQLLFFNRKYKTKNSLKLLNVCLQGQIKFKCI